MPNNDILTGFRVTSQLPLDGKRYFLTLAEMQNLGTNNINAFTYYEDMTVICIETHSTYVWRVLKDDNEAGILTESFLYPANSISNGIDYSGKRFNFFLLPVASDGVDGEAGIDGIDGEAGIGDGNGTYTHIKYAENENGLNMTETQTDASTHMGTIFNQTDSVFSENPADYTWTLIGAGAVANADGIHWTWIKWADSLTEPHGWSENGLGKKYIGFAYNKTTSVMTETFSDYRWEQVLEGMPISGTSKFLHLKFAKTYSIDVNDVVTVTGFSDSAFDTLYIGIAYDQDASYESADPQDYRWGLHAGINTKADTTYTWVKFASTPHLKISDSPINALYVGINTDNVGSVESTDYNDYAWYPIQLVTEIVKPITDRWAWIKYSTSLTPSIADMSDSPTGKTHIGMAFNKPTSVESDVASDYSWSLIAGAIGYTGADGRTYYIHTKYATSADGITNFSDDPLAPVTATYIGLSFGNESAVESTTPADYEWHSINGNAVLQEEDWLYLWVKFSTSALKDDGTVENFSDNISNSTYMGIAYDKKNPESEDINSEDASYYTWNPLTGEQGHIGQNGESLFTWVKWANTPKDEFLSDSPSGKSYMGMAFNRLLPEYADEDSKDYVHYTWYPIVATTQTHDQNNLVRVIVVLTEDPDNFTEADLAQWINDKGLEVQENENIVFQITTGLEPPEGSIPALNSNLALDLTATVLNATDADLDWVINGDTALSNFEVIYWDTQVGTRTTVSLANILTHSLTGLTTETRYQAFVIGYDGNGNSKQSNTVNIDLFADANTPNIKGDAKTTTTIDLSWNIAIPFGHDRFELFQVGTGKIYDTTDVNDLTTQVTGLTAGTSYQFYVIAYNNLTASNQSNTITIVTDALSFAFTAPVIYEIYPLKNAVKFGITMPPLEMDKIIAFRVNYRIVGLTVWQIRDISTDLIQFFESLERDTTYELRIQALNLDNTIQSAWSNIIEFTTLREDGIQILIEPSGGNFPTSADITVYGGLPFQTLNLRIGSIFAVNGNVVWTADCYLQVLQLNSLKLASYMTPPLPISKEHNITLDANGEYVDRFVLGTLFDNEAVMGEYMLQNPSHSFIGMLRLYDFNNPEGAYIGEWVFSAPVY